MDTNSIRGETYRDNVSLFDVDSTDSLLQETRNLTLVSTVLLVAEFKDNIASKEYPKFICILTSE